MPDDRAISRFHDRLFGWYESNGRDLPWRRTKDPYAVMVSEFMLQQTQVPRVIPKYLAFLSRFPALVDVAHAPFADVVTEWQGLGYYRRARFLWETCREIDANHDGDVPLDVEELKALPGIGEYTARAIVIFAINADLATIDTNISAVLQGEFPDFGGSPAERLRFAERLVPIGRSQDWHNALMDYGSLVVRPNNRLTTARSAKTVEQFVGSRRYWRGRVIDRIVREGPASIPQLSEDIIGSEEIIADVVDRLRGDGLVDIVGDLVRLHEADERRSDPEVKG